MNNFICPRPVSIEEIAYRWVKRQIKVHKLKCKIEDCVQDNQIECAKKYATELKQLEEAPLVTYPNPYVCY